MIRRLIILLLIAGSASNIKKVISHYENGQIEEEQNYKNGEKDGEWIWYYKNGQES